MRQRPPSPCGSFLAGPSAAAWPSCPLVGILYKASVLLSRGQTGHAPSCSTLLKRVLCYLEERPRSFHLFVTSIIGSFPLSRHHLDLGPPCHPCFSRHPSSGSGGLPGVEFTRALAPPVPTPGLSSALYTAGPSFCRASPSVAPVTEVPADTLFRTPDHPRAPALPASAVCRFIVPV